MKEELELNCPQCGEHEFERTLTTYGRIIAYTDGSHFTEDTGSELDEDGSDAYCCNCGKEFTYEEFEEIVQKAKEVYERTKIDKKENLTNN